MPIATKSQILEADDRPVEKVNTPEWGGEDSFVLVRSISASERDRFEQSMIEERGKNTRANLSNIRARFAAMCVVDEGGARIFTDAEAVDLGKKSAAVLDRIFGTAQRLNGMSGDDVDELAGN
mgnify:CR=1 FL=1